MRLNLKPLLRLVVPGILLAAAFWGRPYLSALSGEDLKLIGLVPYLLALVCVVLARQFNRSRFLLLAVITAGAFWLIQTRLQVSLLDSQARRLYASLCLELPLVVMFLLLVPERGLVNRHGLLYLLITLALAALSPWLLGKITPLLEDYPQWLQIWPSEDFVMPLALAAIHAVAAGLGLGMLVWRDAEAEAALVASLAAVFLALAWFHLPNASLTFFVVAALIQLRSILKSSHDMAYRDELTGLLGRRAMNERLAGLGSRYSLAMLDIDHFKKFNDTYGHDVGDEVLKLVASQIGRVTGGGIAFRYGGEEFCIIFPRRGMQECEAHLEKVRESIASYTMTIRNKGERPKATREGAKKRGGMATKMGASTVSVTISIGLAERSQEHSGPEEVTKAADGQLYEAKKKGRNRLCYQA